MALILPFPPPTPPPHPALLRVRRLSRPLAWTFAALFGVTAALALVLGVAVLAYAGPRLQTGEGVILIHLARETPPLLAGWTTVGALPLLQRLALVGSGTLMIAPALAILWELRRLFRLYAAGVVLEPVNARLIARVALWLLAYAVAPTAGHLLVSAAGFLDRGWLRLDSLQALFLGAVLLVIARVMRLGADIRADAEAFV